MRRGKGQPVELSQVLAAVLQEAGLSHLPYEDRLRRNWGTLLGPRASRMASLDGLKGWVLRVKVESAVWRQELSFQREAIKRRANEILGAELVKDVVFG